MLTNSEVEQAGSYVEQLRLCVHERELPDSLRIRAAGGCFAIAQDHHHAIIKLVEEKLFASAFSLLRVAFEAYVRGEWLWFCASDLVVEKFMRGKNLPSIGCQLEQLELIEEFEEKTLSNIKKQIWNAMCGYTHTGGIHVQRWASSDGIEASYTKDEVLEVVSFAEVIGSLSVIAIARIAEDNEMAERVLALFKARVNK